MILILFVNLVYLTDKSPPNKIVQATEIRCCMEKGDFDKVKALSLKYFGFDVDEVGKGLQLEEQAKLVYDMTGKIINASVEEIEEEVKIRREQKEAAEKKNKECLKEESEKEADSEEEPKFKDFLENDKKADSLENSDDTKPLSQPKRKQTPCQEDSTNSDEDTLSIPRSYDKASTLPARRKYIYSSEFSSSSATETRVKKEKNHYKSELRRLQAHLSKLKLNSSPDIGAQNNCNGPINITKSFLRGNIIISCKSAPCAFCLKILQGINLPEIDESSNHTPSLSGERFAGEMSNKLYEKRQRTCSTSSSADDCVICNHNPKGKQCNVLKESEAKKLTRLPSVKEENVEDLSEEPTLKGEKQEEVIN